MPVAPLLALDGITKRFEATTALAEVGFELRAGEVHALMGENGAGKSTLMKIAAGIVAPDGGRLIVDGVARRLRAPAEAKAAGIHTVFQELTVLENLDVARNVLIGAEPVRLGGLWLDRRALRAAAQAVLDRYAIPLDARAPVANLSTGQRQMVEIARACAGAPRVLILDEPTSSLGRQEEELLFDLIARLKGEGAGIVYITHRMSEVFRLADRITVLRDGRHVVTDAVITVPAYFNDAQRTATKSTCTAPQPRQRGRGRWCCASTASPRRRGCAASIWNCGRARCWGSPG